MLELPINTLFDRENLVKEITTILSKFDEKCQETTFKKGIYIYGSPGTGKSYFVVQLLKQLGYDSIVYDAGDVRNKSLFQTIDSLGNYSNADWFLSLNRNQLIKFIC